MIYLGIIEDDSLIREGYCTFFNSQPDMQVSVAAGSIAEFLELQVKQPEREPSVILVDIGLPCMSGIDGIRDLKDRYPFADVLMLSVFDDSEHVFKALTSGAVGYVLKTASLKELRNSVLTTVSGGSYLSPTVARKVVNSFCPAYTGAGQYQLSERQREIIQCLVEGLSYKLTADRLHVGLDTVRFHLKNIYKKLQVNSKTEVLSKVYRGEI